MQRVAVFIDGENVGSSHAEAIVGIAARQGEIVLARAYGDVSRLNGWQEALRYKTVHAGKGKNATDLLLSLDALELALEGRFDVCIVASSDRDFLHLAVKLRERGLRVIGAGETKTPGQFRALCSQFVELNPEKSASKACAAPVQLHSSLRDDLIRALLTEHGDAAGMTIQMLGTYMKSRHATGRDDLEERNWRTYLERRASLYDVDPAGTGARVRVRPPSAQR